MPKTILVVEDWYEAFSQIIEMDKNVIVTGYSEFEPKNKSARARTSFCYFKANWSRYVIRFGKKYSDVKNLEKQDLVSNSNLERSIS